MLFRSGSSYPIGLESIGKLDFILRIMSWPAPTLRFCPQTRRNEFVDLAAKHDDEKMVDILRRTWVKMSPAGHQRARALASGLPERERGLVETATQ